MKKSVIKSTSMILTTLVLMLGYQNCSNITTETLNNEEKLSGQIGSGAILPEDSGIIVAETEMGGEQPSQVTTTTIRQREEPRASHDVEEDCHDDPKKHSHDDPKKYSDDGSKKHSDDDSKKYSDDDSKKYSDDDSKKHSDDDSKEVSEAIAECLKKDKDSVEGSVFQDVKGGLKAKGKDIRLIERVKGHVTVKGQDADSRLDNVIEVSGGLVVCNMDVKKIKEVKGRVILVNSRVDEIDDVKGNLHMINSKCAKVSNVSGAVKSSK